MPRRRNPSCLPAVCLLVAAFSARNAAAEPPAAIVYNLRAPRPESQTIEVEAAFPTDNQAEIEIMMPVWTPGYYRVEDYAGRVESLTARNPDGNPLEVAQPRPNRRHIRTAGAKTVHVAYRLSCKQRSVTTNWVDPALCVLNGAATFFTLAGSPPRPHEIHFELPASWKRAATSLPAAPDGLPNHFRAADYDEIVDAPIVAGDPVVHEFNVAGCRHALVDLGDLGTWDGARAARDIEQIVRATRDFWGELPFKNYLFLNVFRPGGGGLEHKNCTLLTASAARFENPGAYRGLLNFISHEYFHAFNVKRLRPVELGPFDYENPPRTDGLWISEGLTSYHAELLVARAGLATLDDYLAELSATIDQLQNSPGRLVQTLAQASLDVWNTSTSGVGLRGSKTAVSYYIKGAVAGFLLDAKIRRLTRGKKSLDDVMRLAYRRYSGAHGFTAAQFRAVAREVAGLDLDPWFHKVVESTDELDYTEALDWYGLHFAVASAPAPPATDPKAVPAEQPPQTWKLAVRPDATPTQTSNLRSLVGVRATGTEK